MTRVSSGGTNSGILDDDFRNQASSKGRMWPQDIEKVLMLSLTTGPFRSAIFNSGYFHAPSLCWN